MSEPERSLIRRDVEDVVGALVVAIVEQHSAVARTIDSGLLLARLHRLPQFREIRPHQAAVRPSGRLPGGGVMAFPTGNRLRPTRRPPFPIPDPPFPNRPPVPRLSNRSFPSTYPPDRSRRPPAPASRPHSQIGRAHV